MSSVGQAPRRTSPPIYRKGDRVRGVNNPTEVAIATYVDDVYDYAELEYPPQRDGYVSRFRAIASDYEPIPTAHCKHCGRLIVQDAAGAWVDPEATGDDGVWRGVCDRHDTFTAEHEPYEGVAR